MSTNLTVQQAISWLNGKGDANAVLAIKEMGLLKYLQNISFSYQASRSPYSGSLANGGTLLWRIPHLIGVGAYAENQSVTDVPKFDLINSGAIEKRSGTFKNEYFDYRMATPEQAVASVNMVVGSLSLSAAADTNAHFWMTCKGYYDLHPEQTMYLPDLTAKKVLSENEARAITVQIAHKRNDLTLIYGSEGYGVDPNEYRTTINGAGAINLSQVLLRLNNSVSAFELAKSMIVNPFTNGVANPNDVIGGRIIIDNMVGLKVAQNVAWNKDYAFDMSGYLGFIQHEDFIAFPVLEPTIGVREVPNNLNHNYIIEYAFTSAFLRPKLGCAIVDEFRAGAENPEIVEVSTGVFGPQVKVGKTLTLVSNKYFDDASTTFTVPEGTTGVTISGNTLTAVTAGTYVVTATNSTDTATINVKVVS